MRKLITESNGGTIVITNGKDFTINFFNGVGDGENEFIIIEEKDIISEEQQEDFGEDIGIMYNSFYVNENDWTYPNTLYLNQDSENYVCCDMAYIIRSKMNLEDSCEIPRFYVIINAYSRKQKHWF